MPDPILRAGSLVSIPIPGRTCESLGVVIGVMTITRGVVVRVHWMNEAWVFHHHLMNYAHFDDIYWWYAADQLMVEVL